MERSLSSDAKFPLDGQLTPILLQVQIQLNSVKKSIIFFKIHFNIIIIIIYLGPYLLCGHFAFFDNFFPATYVYPYNPRLHSLTF
jgi:hypothetical protein